MAAAVPHDAHALTDEATVRFLRGLWQLNRRLQQDIEPLLAQQELDLRRFFILSAVRRGTQYPKALAKELQLPATLLSRYLDQLCSLGYLERQIDAQDSRRTCLSLSGAGQQAHEAAVLDIRAHTSGRLGQLPSATLTALLDAMDLLGTAESAQENTK
ncbi:MarR family winged helix-turn-helix transcriptional regulator [Deinococcus navajonensis]|uniref:MarR family winged helix-turn-helix transcriptional regulator n=1 Tax=Deinococcus navajonensis TaxID=309884 RepID=A0ABV8XPB9_9DEIO